MREDRQTWSDPRGLYLPVLTFSIVGIAGTAQLLPAMTPLGAACAGALMALRRRLWPLIGMACLGLLMMLGLIARAPGHHWLLVAMLLMGGLLPYRRMPLPASLPAQLWAICLGGGVACICLSALMGGDYATALIALGSVLAAGLGAALVKQFELSNGGLPIAKDVGMLDVSRDLLLGRVTSGMLHDLAQPLNVISMANGNLGYIMENLEMPSLQRAQLDERLNRIAAQTEHAAHILNLFRWFGRDRDKETELLNVKSALQQALAATRSNVRHGGVGVRLSGDALDYPLPRRHGLLEMMTVAALLSSFGTFVLADGSKIKGLVNVHAALSPSYIVIAIWCEDEAARPCSAGPIDETTLWLLEQIARVGDGDFRRTPERHGPAQFTIRLARADI